MKETNRETMRLLAKAEVKRIDALLDTANVLKIHPVDLELLRTISTIYKNVGEETDGIHFITQSRSIIAGEKVESIQDVVDALDFLSQVICTRLKLKEMPKDLLLAVCDYLECYWNRQDSSCGSDELIELCNDNANIQDFLFDEDCDEIHYEEANRLFLKYLEKSLDGEKL